MAPDVSLAKGTAVPLPAEPWTEALWTGIGTALDAVLLRAMTYVVDTALTPPPAQIDAIRAAGAPYLAPEVQASPRGFFAFVDSTPAPLPAQVAERCHRTLRDGVVVARQFLSNYRPYAEFDAVPHYPENARIPVEHWTHEPDSPLGTVVALHGFSMGRGPIDSFALMAAEWFKLGLDVALVTLPYHGARAPRHTRFSGEAFAAANPSQLNEAVRQSVSDVLLVVHWLRQRSAAPVGLLGLSLGGYLSALIAGLTDKLEFVIPMVPPVDLADLAWRFYERSRVYGKHRTPPLPREEHEALYRIHSPLTFPLQLPRERALIVAGRGDRIVPPEHPHALWEHWGRPAIHWFSGSHIAPFGRARIVETITKHLARTGIL